MYKVKKFVKVEYLAQYLNDWNGVYEIVWIYKTDYEVVALLKEVDL